MSHLYRIQDDAELKEQLLAEIGFLHKYIAMKERRLETLQAYRSRMQTEAWLSGLTSRLRPEFFMGKPKHTDDDIVEGGDGLGPSSVRWRTLAMQSARVKDGTWTESSSVYNTSETWDDGQPEASSDALRPRNLVSSIAEGTEDDEYSLVDAEKERSSTSNSAGAEEPSKKREKAQKQDGALPLVSSKSRRPAFKPSLTSLTTIKGFARLSRELKPAKKEGGATAH